MPRCSECGYTWPLPRKEHARSHLANGSDLRSARYPDVRAIHARAQASWNDDIEVRRGSALAERATTDTQTSVTFCEMVAAIAKFLSMATDGGFPTTVLRERAQGWHPDISNPNVQRFWDGTRWS